ncbi:hypothetical protein FHT08_003714 [Xanthomonas campestris]|uniref:hypothetical protein n=1 Tax=Xanthomonas sp. CFBP 8151 TaxID=3035310 RepID=UPI00141AF2A0|nr:hypothetical protein [Xanthomonas sp. CFBP 8151]NIJ78580.1 hypothetical protein [Xanthomonas sp. CFBP 8151]
MDEKKTFFDRTSEMERAALVAAMDTVGAQVQRQFAPKAGSIFADLQERQDAALRAATDPASMQVERLLKSNASSILAQLQESEAALREVTNPVLTQAERQLSVTDLASTHAISLRNLFANRPRFGDFVAEAARHAMPEQLKIFNPENYLPMSAHQPMLEQLRVFNRENYFPVSALAESLTANRDISLRGVLAQHAEILESLKFPTASLQAYAKAMSNLWDGSASGDVGGGYAEESEVLTPGPAGLTVRDEATATLHRSVVADASELWATLPAESRLLIILAVIQLLMALPGAYKDSRDLLREDTATTNTQVQTLIDLTRSNQLALRQLAELELQTSKTHADSARNQALIAEGLRFFTSKSAGRPCQIVVATSLRAVEPGRAVKHKALPGQIALCLEHKGRWLEIMYDGPEGPVHGLVLKKHTRWD